MLQERQNAARGGDRCIYELALSVTIFSQQQGARSAETHAAYEILRMNFCRKAGLYEECLWLGSRVVGVNQNLVRTPESVSEEDVLTVTNYGIALFKVKPDKQRHRDVLLREALNLPRLLRVLRSPSLALCRGETRSFLGKLRSVHAERRLPEEQAEQILADVSEQRLSLYYFKLFYHYMGAADPQRRFGVFERLANQVQYYYQDIALNQRKSFATAEKYAHLAANRVTLAKIKTQQRDFEGALAELDKCVLELRDQKQLGLRQVPRLECLILCCLEQKALTLNNQQQQAEAEKLLNQCLQRRQALTGFNTIEVAQIHMYLGNIYYSKNRIPESIAMMDMARDLIVRHQGIYNQDVASSYNNIAYLLPNLNKIEESLYKHTQALEIRR